MPHWLTVNRNGPTLLLLRYRTTGYFILPNDVPIHFKHRRLTHVPESDGVYPTPAGAFITVRSGPNAGP